MKNSKFFYLYLIGGIAALALLIYNVASAYPAVQFTSVAFKVFLVIVLFYLANKTYHEKKDKEMM
jgi:ABC-type phosphate transport system permease subunit